MSKVLYSVACENDDIWEFDSNKRAAMTYARKQKRLGRQHIIVNAITEDGEYLDAIRP